MEERPISRQEMLKHPDLDPLQKATFDAALEHGGSLWLGAEGWVVKDLPPPPRLNPMPFRRTPRPPRGSRKQRRR